MNRENIKIETTVSPEWFEQLNQLSLETGRSVEELVHEALGQYLEQINHYFIPADPVDLESLDIKSKLEILEQKIGLLEPLLNQVANLEVKLFDLEKIVTPEITRSLASEATFAQLLTDEDYDDEPDEVLTDFLPD